MKAKFIDLFQVFKTFLLSALLSSFISSFNVKHWGYVMKHSARLFSGNQLLTF